MKKILLIVLNLLLNPFINCENKIIYLISPPRSLSVAFLRMMEARGDFKIMHEPAMSPYVFLDPNLTADWMKPDAFKTFAEVKQKISENAQVSNVFVKEISFSAQKYLHEDSALVTNPNVYFVFLLRDPHHVVISYYKKKPYLQDSMSHQIGYQATYEIFKDIQAKAINAPLIILSEDLYSKPKETVEKFCKHVGISFLEKSLHWEDLGEEFSGHVAWGESKYKHITHHWHGDAIRSTGFGTPNKYAIDSNGKPTFQEIIVEEHKQACIKAYSENLMYYNKLLASK